MLIFSDRKATFLPTSASFLFPVTLSQDTPMSASQNPSQKGLQGSELHPLEFHSCSVLPPLDSLSGSYHSMKRYTAFPSTLLWVSVAGIPLTRRRTTQQSTCSPHTLGGARSSDPPPTHTLPTPPGEPWPWSPPGGEMAPLHRSGRKQQTPPGNRVVLLKGRGHIMGVVSG